MERRTILRPIIFLCFIFVSSCENRVDQTAIPQVFHDIISETEVPIQHKNIYPYHGDQRVPVPDVITSKEALTDIDFLEYLLSTSYSGFKYWKHQGVNFDLYFERLRNFVTAKDTISIDDFEKEWVAILLQIQDGHIEFIGKKKHRAYKHQSVYFSEIIIEKTPESQLRVIVSLTDDVKVGDLFTQIDIDNYLFKTLSSENKDHYLIGKLAYEPVHSDRLSLTTKWLRFPFMKIA